MIVIKKPMRATIRMARRLTRQEEESLAGDIQNWLLTKKSIICEVKTEVMKHDNREARTDEGGA